MNSLTHHPALADGLTVRRWSGPDTDPVTPITGLLHRAYAGQVAMGLRPLAGRQDDATTLRRLSSGEAWLALRHGDLVGCIILNEQEPDAAPDWFHRPRTCSFSMFAVDPRAQNAGIGRALLTLIERRATQAGNDELALSMAEPDHALRDFYLKRGFRIITTWQWPYTNYLSLIMSKRLPPTPPAPTPAAPPPDAPNP